MGESRQLAKDAFWDNIIPSDSRINKSDSDDAINEILDAACEEAGKAIGNEIDAFEKREIEPIREAIGHITERFRAELDALKAGAPPSVEPPGRTVALDPSVVNEPRIVAITRDERWAAKAKSQFVGLLTKNALKGAIMSFDMANCTVSPIGDAPAPAPELDGKTAWDALHPPTKKYNICVSHMYGPYVKTVIGVVNDVETARRAVKGLNEVKPSYICVFTWEERGNEVSCPANNEINDI